MRENDKICVFSSRGQITFVLIGKVSEWAAGNTSSVFQAVSTHPFPALCTQLESDGSLDAVQSCYNDGDRFCERKSRMPG